MQDDVISIGRDASRRPRAVPAALVVLTFGALLVQPRPLAAQAPGQASRPAQAPAEVKRFGVGFQSSFPAYGLSGMMDVGEQFAVQGVLGAFGTLTTLSGRGIYRFQRNATYNLYGFGSAGLWRWDGGHTTESSLGVGGGGGVELDWRSILGGRDGGSSFPPLMSSIDIGFTLANFEHYNFNALSIGAGLHYRF